MPSFPRGRHSGTVVPLDRSNVDTDAIIPKQYGRSAAGVIWTGDLDSRMLRN